MKLRVSRSAERDLSSGYTFFEQQEEGLGAYFLKSLYADLEALPSYAGVHRKVSGFHRSQAKRFPYTVYNSVDADVVTIRAVLDARREPAWIRRRLRDQS